MVGLLVTPEVASGSGAGRGHDVPADTPAADVVEVTDTAGQLDGVVVTGGEGADEANALGLGGDARQHGRRLEVVAGTVTDDRLDDRTVGQEDGVECGRLGLLGDRGVVVDRVGGERVAAGQAPGAAEDTRVEDVDVDVELVGHADLSVCR
ncbi:hypothetical protein QFW82_01290 [Streptomyces malaysiensis subsp. malaysiensis]|uniref:hypothetical protein n=1 Tax=Streptomyces sp. NA07423 TaxID=3042026 RepID=UPI0024C0B3A2|nr:hypothetical protein [Streptomyces sp. NA07423]WHX15739.1 hypothetical protein QFW82_01290 [Streptomyces sp. NA07423]